MTTSTAAHHRQARGLEALDHHCTSFFVRVPMGRGGSFYISESCSLLYAPNCR